MTDDIFPTPAPDTPENPQNQSQESSDKTVPERSAPTPDEASAKLNLEWRRQELERRRQEIIEELRELAYNEAEPLEYLPKRVGKTRRHSLSAGKLALMFAILFIVLFMSAARLVFGRGWIKNMFGGNDNLKSFTIPIVTHDELEESYYQPDGRYTVEGIYKTCSPSIVTIEAFLDDNIYSAYGQGSGIIMTSDGYIITNAHVIADAKLAIIVRLYDGTEYNAKVVGSDIKTDLAIVKITADGLTPAQFGDTSQLKIGEQVVAIGSPAGFEHSCTTGIISGLNRTIKVNSINIGMDCIQIDAAINPGNSGGALLNMWGQVIGITSSKLEANEYDNIGFAISIDAAKPILEELIENGGVLGRPKIGISFYEVSDSLAKLYDMPAGLHIAEISPDCDIANTPLAVDDVITEMNGVTVRSADDVYKIILKLHPGDEVTAKVVRVLESGNTKEFEITFKLMKDTSASIQEDTGAEDDILPMPNPDDDPEPEEDPEPEIEADPETDSETETETGTKE